MAKKECPVFWPFFAFAQNDPKEAHVYGLPPNLMHDSDVLSSDFIELASRSTEALALSLEGTPQEADLAVSSGHAHDSLLTDIDWEEFAVWRPTGSEESKAGDDVPTATTADETSATEFGWLVAIIPAHVKEAKVRARMSMPAPGGSGDGTLFLKMEAYDLGAGDASTVVQTLDPISLQSVLGGIQHENKWTGASRLKDVGSYLTVAGRKIVGLKLFRQVSAGEGAIFEIVVGRFR